MDAPERIWTASTGGKCHVGFDTPSMNYTIEYIRADLAAPDLAELVEAGQRLVRLYDAAMDDLLGVDVHRSNPDSEEMAEIRRVLVAPSHANIPAQKEPRK